MLTISKFQTFKNVKQIKSTRTLLLPQKTDTMIKNVSNQNFEQFKLRECFWLASVDVMSRTKKGIKTLSNIVKGQNFNNYVLKFPFFEHKIPVNTAEIDKTRQAQGNQLLNVLEVGWAKLKSIDLDDIEKDKLYPLEGGRPEKALRDFLYGEKISIEINHKNEAMMKRSKQNIKALFEDAIKEPEKYCLVAVKKIIQRDKKTGEILDSGKHAYAIRNITKNEITLANPWNNKKSIKLSYNQLFKSFKEVDGLEIKDLPKLTLTSKYKNKVFQMPDKTLEKKTRKDILSYIIAEPSEDKRKQYILNMYNTASDRKKNAIWKNLYLLADKEKIYHGKFDDRLYEMQKAMLHNSNDKVKDKAIFSKMPMPNTIFIIKKRLKEKPGIETVKTILSKIDFFSDKYLKRVSQEIIKTNNKDAILELTKKINSEPDCSRFNPSIETKVKIIDEILKNCTNDGVKEYVTKIKDTKTSNIYKYELWDPVF